MPRDLPGDVTGGDDRKKKRDPYRDPYDLGQPSPSAPASVDRVAVIQRLVGNALPTDVHWALANLNEREEDMARAARRAARLYDTSPQFIWGNTRAKDLKDPITGDEMRLQTFRNMTDGLEPSVIYQMVTGAVKDQNRRGRAKDIATAPKGAGKEVSVRPADDTVKAGHVVKLMDIIGKHFKEDQLKITAGVGMAVQLADEGVAPKELAHNLDIVTQWADTQPTFQGKTKTQIGIAIEAAKNKVKLNTVMDVNAFVNPVLSAGSAQDLQRLQDLGISQADANRAIELARQNRERLDSGQTPLPIPDDLKPAMATFAVAPNFLALNDLAQFDGSVDDYFKRAQDFKDQIDLRAQAWENSPLNRYVVTPFMWGVDKANRVFEGIAIAYNWTQKYNPVTAPANYLWATLKGKDPAEIIKPQIEQLAEDEMLAFQGKLRVSDVMVRDWGANRWQAEGTEFLLGWYFDPLIIAGKGLRGITMRNVNPQLLAKLKGGEVAGSKMEKYVARIDKFVNRNFTKFSAAMKESDEAVVSWAHSLPKPVMGGSAVDVPFLLKVREEMVAGRLSGRLLDDELRGVLRTHFTGGLPAEGSLADVGYRSRLASVEEAKATYRAAGIGDGRAYNEVLKREAALHADDLGDPSSLLPRRLEVPGYAVKERIGQLTGLDRLPRIPGGKTAKKLININPGGTIKIHEGADRWFRLSARRAGMADAEVLAWETKAAKALASGNPENELKTLLDDFTNTVAINKGAAVGISEENAKQIVKDLVNEKNLGANSPTFGALNTINITEDGQPFIRPRKSGTKGDLPVGSSQLVNALPALDPIIINRAMNEYVGLVRKMRAEFLGALGKDIPPAVKAKLSLAYMLNDKVVMKLGRAALKVFKFGAVARPAYIFRVVLGDELLRSFATTQSAWEHVLSYGGAQAMLASPRPWVRAAGTKVDEAIGTKLDDISARTIGGERLTPLTGMPPEPLANTYLDYADLTTDTMKTVQRKVSNLQASGEFGFHVPGESDHLAAWERALNRTLGNSPGLSEGLRVMGDRSVRSLEGLKNHLKYWVTTPDGKAEMRRLGRSGYHVDEWVDDASNIVHGYTMGSPELARLAYLREVDQEALKAFPLKVNVGGEELAGRPIISGPKLSKVTPTVANSWAQRWYGAFVRLPENVLNRQPYYRTWKARSEAAYTKVLTDSGVELTPALRKSVDDASRRFALTHNKKIMFDFTENSRIGELGALIFPFSQPWLENITVWGHILTRRNPALVGYVNRLAQAGVSSGFIRKDPDTGEWVVPETWWMATAPILWMIGGRESGGGGPFNPFSASDKERSYSVSTRLTSLNLFASSTLEVAGMPLPAPGMGPFTLPIIQNALDNKTIPSWAQKYIFEYGPGPKNFAEWGEDTFVPRWLRQTMAAIAPEVFDKRQYEDLAGDYLRLQEYMGQEIDVERAHGQARQTMAYLALTAALFPGAVSIKYPHSWLETEYHDKIDEFDGDVTKARDWFLLHHPEYALITIPKTAATRISNVVNEKGEQLLQVAGLPALPPPAGVRPASTAYYEGILKQPGFKEFAHDPKTALWAMALVFQSNNPEADKFDMSAYAAQVSRGEIRQRTALEIYNDYREQQFNEAWNVIDQHFDEGYYATPEAPRHGHGQQAGRFVKGFKQLEEEGRDMTDEEYKQLTRERAAELYRVASEFGVSFEEGLVQIHPTYGQGFAQFVYESGGNYPEGVNPIILHTARAAMDSPVAKNFPAMKGLREYWDIRMDIRGKLEGKGLDGLESEGAAALKKQYTEEVGSILERHPEFELFYNMYFSNDLKYNLPTEGQVIKNSWHDTNDPRYGIYLDFDTKYDQVSNDVAELRAAGSKANQAEISAAYQKRTNLINSMYSTPEGRQVIKVWMKEKTSGERAALFGDWATTPQAFYSRMDWDLALSNYAKHTPDEVPKHLSANATKWLQQVQEMNVETAQWKEKTDGTESTADKHIAVSKFIQSKLGKDKSFDTAIQAMNTWGWGAIAEGYTTQGGKAGKSWRAILEYANEWKATAAKNKIHGDDPTVTFNPDDRAWYNNGRDAVGAYIDVLKKWSPQFARQWEELSKQSSADTLLYWLYPEVYFTAGEVDAY